MDRNAYLAEEGRAPRRRSLRRTFASPDQTDIRRWVFNKHSSYLVMSMQKPATASDRIFGHRQHYKISFAELQRIRLRILQCKLVSHSVAMRFNDEEPSDWEEDLARYVKAMQDYDYMSKWAGKKNDPFFVTANRRMDNEVLQMAMRDVPAVRDADLKPAFPLGKWNPVRVCIGGSRSGMLQEDWWEGFLGRLKMALFGGAFLITPMWLMILHNTLYTGLISTTAFVTVFGIILSMYAETNSEVLSGTAGYAAVLVVFVGLNTAS